MEEKCSLTTSSFLRLSNFFFTVLNKQTKNYYLHKYANVNSTIIAEFKEDAIEYGNVFETNYEYVKFDMWSIRVHQISKRMKYNGYESLHSSFRALVLYVNKKRNLLLIFIMYFPTMERHLGKTSPDSCHYIYY